MLDEIRNLKWAPRSIQEKTKSLRNAHNRLEQKLSRPPLEEELAEEMEMSIEQFRKMMLQIGPSAIFLSSTRSIEDKEETYLEAHFEDTETLNPMEQVISNETKSILADAIRTLPEKESVVISLYYYEEMTMKEIGQVLSITESRVCQIHSKAILRLFQVLNTKMALDESNS
jgi:RNA polymerase sigma factor for flagellar operon FliA